MRGLTTAATVWLAAAVGMASGAGLPVLAVATTVGLMVITRGFPPLSRFIDRHRRSLPILRLSYADGHGVLRNVLTACTGRGWAVHRLAVDRETVSEEGQRIAVVTLRLQGRGDLTDLTAELAELPGVRSTTTGAEDPLED